MHKHVVCDRLGLMGPIIGMSPDKKAESPGVVAEERAGRQAPWGGAGTLPEAQCGASSPLATRLDQAAADEELTNLNWLHENLLQNFTLGGPGGEAAPGGGGSPLFDIEGEPALGPLASASSSSSGGAGQSGERDSVKSKPPFSFSLLIYMAIEQSPSKSLPVKDIYGWILEHFPYFSSAPTGWKNSVRHNLSLNKCFRKVEKNLGKVNGKGSLWCVDPEYRPNLIQALKKQHFPTAHAFCTPPASPPSASSPPRHLLLQGCSLKESDIDAATAMMLLNSAPGHHADRCGPDSPLDLSRPDSVLVSSDPKQDHNYSSVPVQRCASPASSSSSSSALLLDEGGRRAHRQPRRAGSEGFHSDEDSDAEPDTYPESPEQRRGPHGRPSSSPPPPSLKAPANKRARREAKAELDEELKEAAGSLLHLAGIRTCLEATSKHAARSKKLGRK
ncbi:LOW QUALITY PROTEIN: forkhead box protein N2 [Alosa alosa]|uniref:LOW QUALITY PROTEIN: forkhead box protein N2 n=1 Tax=Alosa alosa TaxID=278164 RepID=UPI002015181D|nr:LOW QUALITY PROTEIN: forkhead box protein N2 [Alosa alosa]